MAITPLHMVRNADAVQALVDAGANIKARDETSHTPLHRAALLGSADAVLALLDAGADPKAQTKDGKTPWFFRARKCMAKRHRSLLGAE